MLIMNNKWTVLIAIDIVFFFEVFKYTIKLDFVGVGFHLLNLHHFLYCFADVELLEVLSEWVWIYLGIIKQVLNDILDKIRWWLLDTEVKEQVFKYHLSIFNHCLFSLLQYQPQRLIKTLLLFIYGNYWIKRVSQLVRNCSIDQGQQIIQWLLLFVHYLCRYINQLKHYCLGVIILLNTCCFYLEVFLTFFTL